MEPALTSFEQATAAAVRMGAGAGESLTRRGFAGILQRAHGRECSRAVESRGEEQPSSRGVLWPSAGLGRGSRTPPAYIALAVLARTKTEPSPRSTDGGVALLALSKWLTCWPLLTDNDLCGLLGCSAEGLTRLRLCYRPGQRGPGTEAEDVRHVCERFGADPDTLADLLGIDL